ncbi:MAG: DUF3194 domain-containing protein [Candidatus Thorarchaeota archaeon]|jgi:hypothetical protein
MSPVFEIGLPDLSEEDIETLAEECEVEITNFIFDLVPAKSVEELNVSCSLNLADILDLEVEINLTQGYDSGHSLDSVIEKATEHAVKWFETRILEMKGR